MCVLDPWLCLFLHLRQSNWEIIWRSISEISATTLEKLRSGNRKKSRFSDNELHAFYSAVENVYPYCFTSKTGADVEVTQVSVCSFYSSRFLTVDRCYCLLFCGKRYSKGTTQIHQLILFTTSRHPRRKLSAYTFGSWFQTMGGWLESNFEIDKIQVIFVATSLDFTKTSLHDIIGKLRQS